MNKLLAAHTLQEFNRLELDDFMETLQDVDQSTVRTSINSAQDIKLSPEWRLVSNGFKLSLLAAKQLCNHVARGLWPLAADIGGLQRTARGYDNAISAPMAANIVNGCAILRFNAVEGICGRDMVVNHATRTVDGIIGPRYRLLPHHQLIDAVIETLPSCTTPLEFHSSRLWDRRMTATFMSVEHLVAIEPDLVFGGLCITNSEAGECGIRCSLMLDFGDGLRCLARPRHIAHSGKDFGRRLGRLLGGVLSPEWWAYMSSSAELAKHVLKTPLELLDTAEKKISSTKRTRLKMLLADYVDKGIATSLVRQIIYMGADGKEIPQTVSATEIKERTMRDVVFTLMRAAQHQYSDTRERLQRAAFDFLTRSIRI